MSRPEPDTSGGRAWALLLPSERYEAERLVHHEVLDLTDLAGETRRLAAGDRVVVLADGEPPLAVALGRVAPAPGHPTSTRSSPGGSESGAEPLVVTYTRRVLDRPVPADRLVLDGPVTALAEPAYEELAGRLGPPLDRRSWLVSLDLPIEAETPAEAVRIFWAYVQELGPRELPAFVSPTGDELAMQAFVLGAEANQDPEEDD